MYQIPISVVTPLKLKIKLSKMNKKEEPLNLSYVETSEVKTLACFVSLCQWKFQKLDGLMDVDGCSTNKRVSIISEKLNWVVKANKKSLKGTCEYTYYSQ